MQVEDYIRNILRVNDNTKLIIYGGGKRGLGIFELLKAFKFDVYAFADNSEEKQKKGVNNLPCFSKNELIRLESKNDLCVIVSPKNSDDLYLELSAQLKNVYSSEVYEVLNSISGIKQYGSFFPIGHFYSLYPDLNEFERRKSFIYNKRVSDIDLCENEQKDCLLEMAKLYASVPKWDTLESEKESIFRYRYHNTSFSPADAITLHCMLRLLKPKKMIEVGCGWSSAVSLDTNEFYLNNLVNMTFIEPYPELMNQLLKETDDVNLIQSGLQDVPLAIFESLEAGDILFIDSTHVSKAGSDVNFLFFEIMPRLQSGVYVHLHDVFYPFEYPEKWTKEGKVWNELYLLRAFLQCNKTYKIVYFQNMIEKRFKEIISDYWPFKDPFYGGSFYMQKC